jgi:hypothetical protein
LLYYLDSSLVAQPSAVSTRINGFVGAPVPFGTATAAVPIRETGASGTIFGTTPLPETHRYAALDGSQVLYHGSVEQKAAPGPFTRRVIITPARRDPRFALAQGERATHNYSVAITFDPPTAGLSETYDEEEEVVFVGQESVTVPAGTFMSCRFDLKFHTLGPNRTEWIAVNSGLLVKVQDSSNIRELSRFELRLR